jgi:hypothetical protein
MVSGREAEALGGLGQGVEPGPDLAGGVAAPPSRLGQQGVLVRELGDEDGGVVAADAHPRHMGAPVGRPHRQPSKDGVVGHPTQGADGQV